MIIEYLTAILVFVTAIYVYLTHRMAKASEASVQEIREQSEATRRPYIVVAPFIRPHTSVLYLRVRNTGQTSAHNLRLTLDRDFFQFGENTNPSSNLRTVTAFSTPIDSLPPGAELIFSLAQGWVLFGKSANPEVSPVQFNVSANYQFFGKTVEELSAIDLRPYIGSEGERDPIVEELERIRKVMEQKE
jgi:hypothetical protein